ncbi:MAG: 3,4-dihydroxy-2-butanone-4-phosphate synthase [Metallosphaera yellowstonensis]|jgi:3,4-dihydroxy-2-butanone 4-phosphate synthase|uniref:3,4-dihydroxy-2-butanone 4-phosphate synthase n=1 Tax=Metallosphaera yellowstonensis MK1 TaxID=671065 RepID=H2C2D7_9CREN|nr:3,4-dihydroxy-2-butanone-4-phosphate synthase [Metallosphaera yellowstonensis]EHP70408.1 3,4-dihydroxy-2-butanone 4-phosphate synthase [Metallosphaera yellowstonensis MK1]
MFVLQEIRKDLESGLPVLLYDFDGREEEVDMVFYGGSVTWKTVQTLRKEAGGLICYATGKREAELLGLPFQTEIMRSIPSLSRLVKRPVYGDEPAFSLWVNHRKTRTGISDEDRALTISSLHRVVETLKSDVEEARETFYQDFYTPGHVPILVSRGLEKRKGHTEMSVKLMEAVGLEKSVVLAEMLGDGRSMGKEEAKRFAKHNGFHFLEGIQVIKVISP